MHSQANNAKNDTDNVGEDVGDANCKTQQDAYHTGPIFSIELAENYNPLQARYSTM